MLIPNCPFPVYEDAPGSPSETYSFDGSRASRSFWFPDATPLKRFQFAKAMLGVTTVLTEVPTGGGSSRSYLHRQIPYGSPAVIDGDVNLSGAPFLWCKSVPTGAPVPTVPSADATGVATYKAYRFGCEFRGAPYRVADDLDPLALAQQGPLAAAPARPDEGDALARGLAATRYVSREVTPGFHAEVVKEAVLLFQAVPGPGPHASFGVPYTVFQAEVAYHWWEVPVGAIPRGAIAACSNAVNTGEFDGWAEGTLLYKSYAERQYNAPLGPGLWADITYHFSYRPNTQRVPPYTPMGHNAKLALLRPSEGGHGVDYYFISGTGLGTGPADGRQYIHPFRDFSTLFRPPQP